MAAARSPNIDPEAPRVKALPLKADTRKPTMPEIVKMTKNRNGPNALSITGPS